MENKKELLIDLFENNNALFCEAIEELDSYNGYLGDDRLYDMEMLPELLHGKDIIGLLNMAYFGDDRETWHTDSSGRKIYGSFNPNRNYFYFNGYGNLCSCDHKDYSGFLDNYFVDALLENYQHLYLNDEIMRIIEED
jgi:hypothetical protein